MRNRRVWCRIVVEYRSLAPRVLNNPEDNEPCEESLDLDNVDDLESGQLPNNQLLVKLLSPHARMPTREGESAAGYDLYCAQDKPLMIQPENRKLVYTGIAIANPGTQLYARIDPRYRLSMKDLDIGAGVVIADYGGSVKVLLINNSTNNFQINQGDHMAQLILERIENPECVLVNSLPETKRGNRGFSSTGIYVNSADLGCGDPMVIPVAIRKNNCQESSLSTSAMIDSGASTQFIDPDFASQFGLTLDLKPIPESPIVVDGHESTPLTHTCTLDLLIDQYLETLTFQVTKLAGCQMILGTTWLKKHNSAINWTQNTVFFVSGYCQMHCLPI